MNVVTATLLLSIPCSAWALADGIDSSEAKSLPCSLDTFLNDTDGRDGICIARDQSCNTGETKDYDSRSTESICPGGCSGQGDCIGGHCVCKVGFRGADCSVAGW